MESGVSWETVVLALGASLIGAVAGVTGAWFAFRGARMNIQYQEREARRGRVIEACRGFSRAWSELALLVMPLLDRVREVDEEALKELEIAAARYVEMQSAVRLLLGPQSEAGKAARETGNQITIAVGHARLIPVQEPEELEAWREEGGAALTGSEEVHERFVSEAFDEIERQESAARAGVFRLWR